MPTPCTCMQVVSFKSAPNLQGKDLQLSSLCMQFFTIWTQLPDELFYCPVSHLFFGPDITLLESLKVSLLLFHGYWVKRKHFIHHRTAHSRSITFGLSSLSSKSHLSDAEGSKGPEVNAVDFCHSWETMSLEIPLFYDKPAFRLCHQMVWHSCCVSVFV